MTELIIKVPDKLLHPNSSITPLSQEILLSAALQLYQAGGLTSKRAAKLANLSHSQFLQTAGKSTDLLSSKTDHLSPMTSLQGSRYFARVLWALREGEKNKLTPMTASEIAKYISTNSNFEVQETNTARFFRDSRKSGRFEEYWIASEDDSRLRYRLTQKGRGLFELSFNAKPLSR